MSEAPREWETGQQLLVNGSDSVSTTGEAATHKEGRKAGPFICPAHRPGAELACELVLNWAPGVLSRGPGMALIQWASLPGLERRVSEGAMLLVRGERG